MTRVKLCGLTRPEDVKAAVAMGFDALGFILVPSSPRRVSLDAVAALRPLIPPFVTSVAVVAKAAKEDLERLVASRLFDAVQFHGGEAPDVVASVPLRRIVALSVAGRGDLDGAKNYDGVADAFLLDTKGEGGRGGTGRPFDWNVCLGFDFSKPIILAGGLGPDNLRRAVGTVRPEAVDLNSRLEKAPGVKDHRLMEEALRVLGRTGAGEGRGMR
ncbi:MAG: phosphoribosylanthranilate isomerase [Synergistaceae bacterium]|jgi:phosphoribosylanthranilate isomerase|nr:phosphoribosylanthranilate isomerase [Synergistaceae bacterium]